MAEITQQTTEATYFRAVVDFLGTIQQASQGWTAWKNFIRDGGDGKGYSFLTIDPTAGYTDIAPFAHYSRQVEL